MSLSATYSSGLVRLSWHLYQVYTFSLHIYCLIKSLRLSIKKPEAKVQSIAPRWWKQSSAWPPGLTQGSANTTLLRDSMPLSNVHLTMFGPMFPFFWAHLVVLENRDCFSCSLMFTITKLLMPHCGRWALPESRRHKLAHSRPGPIQTQAQFWGLHVPDNSEQEVTAKSGALWQCCCSIPFPNLVVLLKPLVCLPLGFLSCQITYFYPFFFSQRTDLKKYTKIITYSHTYTRAATLCGLRVGTRQRCSKCAWAQEACGGVIVAKFISTFFLIDIQKKVHSTLLWSSPSISIPWKYKSEIPSKNKSHRFSLDYHC